MSHTAYHTYFITSLIHIWLEMNKGPKQVVLESHSSQAWGTYCIGSPLEACWFKIIFHQVGNIIVFMRREVKFNY